ncbi:hypothetical protein [Pseudomarimonas arenosa]|uniref:Uncharacterized protein n=1 Tax=Pseudomarimonas arenosa TaxID=2774145 RepID=A0AAW3ZQ91_9GAMM|nr:hypothetical protein [Pseudomarimonas arenosa]MBD8527705.1 hypothetical protein [Pseudomarimonas arenosa]
MSKNQDNRVLGRVLAKEQTLNVAGGTGTQAAFDSPMNADVTLPMSDLNTGAAVDTGHTLPIIDCAGTGVSFDDDFKQEN